MRERSSSGISSDMEEDLIQKDKKKMKISENSSCDESMQELRQDDFDFMWDKLAKQLRRILHLKMVEAVRIVEEAYNLSTKGYDRPRLIEECEKLLSNFCAQLSQSLSSVQGPNLLKDYYRNWKAYLLAMEDINTIIKTFRIQGIVKNALSSWWACLFSPLRLQLKSGLDTSPFLPKDVSFMDICSVTEPVSDSPDYHTTNSNGHQTDGVGEGSIFTSYYQEFSELFKLESILKQLFPGEESIMESEDDYLFEDILKMKIPNVNVSNSKEEGINGFVNTSLLPSELVFEIFTFLTTEKELKIAGQVCRRWYVLTKQKSLWHALKARNAVSKDWVRMYSAEGHEFTVGLEEANRSGTLLNILKMHTAVEAITHTVRFSTIRTHILEKIAQYFYYKVRYTNSTSVIPDFPIEPEIALEILMASNLLDC